MSLNETLFRNTKQTNGRIPPGLPNLVALSHIRREISKVKNQNPDLINRQLNCHHNAISEYSVNQLSHLISLIQNFDLQETDLTNFNAQPQINSKMRFLIFDFLMYSHVRLNLSTSTLFLAFSIIDRYSAKYVIESCNYQLLALTSLWIASKYWDSKNRAVTLPILINLCCNQYTPNNFKDTELHLLKALNWTLCQAPTHDSLIDMIIFIKDDHSQLEADKALNAQQSIINKYLSSHFLNINEIKLGSIMLCELTSFDLDFSFKFDNLMIAKAAIILVMLTLNFNQSNKWENFNTTCCSDPEIVEIMNSMLNIVMDKDALPSSFKAKYLNRGSSSDSSDYPSTPAGEQMFQFFNAYSLQLQLDDICRLQEFDLSSSFTDLTQVSGNSDSVTMTPISTVEHHFEKSNPFAVTPASSSSPSPNTFTPMSSFIDNSSFHNNISPGRSNSLPTPIAGPIGKLARTIRYNKPLHTPLTPTTPTMLRKQNSKKIVLKNFIRKNSLSYHERNRSISSKKVGSFH